MKKIAIGFIVILVGIQFFSVNKTNPPVTAEIDAPPEVMSILKRSCYDCHSNETKWPWYSYVAPVSWLVTDDVNEGRKHLNFSDWGDLTRQKMVRKKEHIGDEVKEGGMPLWKYTLIHSDAKLTDKDKNIILEWSGQGNSGEDEDDD